MAETEKSVYDVSRQSFDPARVAEVAESLGIATEETSLDLKNEKKEVVKTIKFVKVLFEKPTGPEDTPDERLARLVAFFEELQPASTNDKGEVIRENNPLDVAAGHVTYSLDLTLRGGIRSKEALAIQGPDKEIAKQAKKLAAYKGITEDAALELVKLAWGVE